MKSFKSKEKTKLSKFLLVAYDGGLSFSMLNKLFRKKDIKVNGTRVSKDLYVDCGDEITVYYDGEKPSVQYKILYSDENVLVVYKPKGITSEDFFKELSKDETLYFCHRLDRNTDGVMIFARNEASYNEIVCGFKDRSFKKLYRARVYGVMDKKEKLLEGYLFKDAKNSIVTVTDEKVKGSVNIRTKYRVLSTDGETSILEVELLTGRTHQIRAHLAHVGHFILGDGKYGNNAIDKKFGVKDLALSAISLTLRFDKEDYLYYLNEKTFKSD